MMTDHQQIIEAEERLLTAVQSDDQMKLKELFHDELVVLGRDRPGAMYATGLGTTGSDNMKIRKVKILDRQINLTGNTAMVLVVEKVMGKYKGHPFEGRYLYMRVWKRTGTDWKVAAASGSMPVIEF
ncbi:nuclear transport factor 2 family protein [Dyadobacter helix]|nr:nuclear transport factor 2 family protein [Dyadobacter sp. CECT 9275]